MTDDEIIAEIVRISEEYFPDWPDACVAAHIYDQERQSGYPIMRALTRQAGYPQNALGWAQYAYAMTGRIVRQVTEAYNIVPNPLRLRQIIEDVSRNEFPDYPQYCVAMHTYNARRPKHAPTAKSILKEHGLPHTASAWRKFAEELTGLTIPEHRPQPLIDKLNLPLAPSERLPKRVYDQATFLDGIECTEGYRVEKIWHPFQHRFVPIGYRLVYSCYSSPQRELT